MLRCLRFSVLLLLLPLLHLDAQISVVPCSDSLSPVKIVYNHFIGTGVRIANVRYRGEKESLGIFSDPQGRLGFDSGIVLSTGLASHIIGPNVRSNAGANFGRYSFLDEDLVTKTDMCDGASLEFDFVPQFDSIVFDFIFGSEEYPEFVGKEFNDVFAFYLNQKSPDHTRPVNIGQLPNGMLVMINNVNHLKNSEWYVANDKPTDPLYDYVEYDGLTKALTAHARVTPLKVYHLKIVIADLGDCEYDSGVLLKAKSFRSIYQSKHIQKPFRRIYHLNFDVASAKLGAAEQWKIRQMSDSLSAFVYDSIVVIGHTDSTGNEADNRILSQKRAETVKALIAPRLKAKTLISAYGKASAQPLQPNSTEQGRAFNRRTEILFYRKPR